MNTVVNIMVIAFYMLVAVIISVGFQRLVEGFFDVSISPYITIGAGLVVGFIVVVVEFKRG